MPQGSHNSHKWPEHENITPTYYLAAKVRQKLITEAQDHEGSQ